MGGMRRRGGIRRRGGMRTREGKGKAKCEREEKHLEKGITGVGKGRSSGRMRRSKNTQDEEDIEGNMRNQIMSLFF